MRNQVWKTALSAGLMALASVGAVIGVEPFERFRSVSAQEMRQDAEQIIRGRLSAESETMKDGSYFNAHTFTAEAGQSLLIEMMSEEFDTYLSLLDAEGIQIAENDDGENGTNAQIAVTIPAAGEYTILANSYSAGETGAYSITVQPTTTEVVQRAETRAETKAEADRLLQQGFQQFQVSQFRDTLVSWEAALQLYRQINARKGEAASLGNLGLAYARLGQYQTAIGHCEQSLVIFREVGDLRGEAYFLEIIGSVYATLDEHVKAIDYYEQSLSLAREIDVYQGRAELLAKIGDVYILLSESLRAIDYYEQSLSLAREVGEHQSEANALRRLGAAYATLSEYKRAIEYQVQSLSLAREIDDRQGEADTLVNLGDAYFGLGEYRTAIDYLEQSLSLAREIDARHQEAESLRRLGNAYAMLGEYWVAINYQEQSLAIFREAGHRQGEANLLVNLGSTQWILGAYQTAIDYHEQSLAIAREIDYRVGEIASLSNLGLAYRSLGDYQAAINYHEQSLTIAHEIGNRKVEAASLGNLGLVYNNLGEYRRAVDCYEQSLTIIREIGDRQGEANVLAYLGDVYIDLGEYQKAIEYQEQSLAITREIGDLKGEADALSTIGAAYLSVQQYAEAERVLYSAIEIWHVLRDSELPDVNKVSLFETQVRSYMLLQQALVVQNKTNPALEIAERSRARALVELITDKISERAAEAITTELPSLAEIQRTAQQQNATLVSYSIINFQDEDPILYVWIIQPTGEISFEQIDLTTLTRPLSELVTVSRSTIGARSRNNDATIVASLSPEAKQQQQQNLKQLYDILIAPIASKLPTDESDLVIFIPQGELFLVPFAALVDENDQYLIENHTISISPSIQALALTNQLSNPNATLTANPLIVGNPTMPKLWNPDTNTEVELISLLGAENEAMAIAQQLKTDALLHDNASETIVAERMQTASLIHLATHGLLDYGTPEETGVRDVPGAIALAPDSTNDGLLTSAEIFAMQLQAELVVLSACDTGRGTITSDGVIGLSRSLMQAGVPSVVVSLWSVPDDSTEFLMKEFYANLEEMDKVQALRQAMLTTMQNPEYTEPLKWAAFTLVGEPE